MYKQIKGNLLDSPDPLIIHGCNAQGVMGSGVAKAIRDKWPTVYTEYTKMKSYELGYVQFCVLTDPLDQQKIVANAITQKFYGRDGKKYVSYDAVDIAMSTINTFCSERNITKVSLPMLGAGLGGGNWDIIEQIIISNLYFPDVTVYYI